MSKTPHKTALATYFYYVDVVDDIQKEISDQEADAEFEPSSRQEGYA